MYLQLMSRMTPDLQEQMRELPSRKRERFEALGLSRYDTLLLADDVATAKYFDAALDAGAPPKLAANWILSDLSKHCNVSVSDFDPRRSVICAHLKSSGSDGLLRRPPLAGPCMQPSAMRDDRSASTPALLRPGVQG